MHNIMKIVNLIYTIVSKKLGIISICQRLVPEEFFLTSGDRFDINSLPYYYNHVVNG